MPKADVYVIWSHRHNRWWGPRHAGYVTRLPEAGCYSKEEAVEIIFNALPGANIAIDVEMANKHFSQLLPDEVAGDLDGWRYV